MKETHESIFKKAMDSGASPRLAEMLACRQSPALKTDTRMFAGMAAADPLGGVHSEVRQAYADKAAAAGVSIKGKKYISQLADSPGDPEAWVESRGDMRRVLEKRGWGSEGEVKTTAREPTSDVDIAPPAAEDLVEERAVDILAVDGCEGICSVKEYDAAKEKARDSLKAPE